MSGEEDVRGSKTLSDVKEAGTNQTPGKDDADPAEGSGRPRWLVPVVSAVVVVVFVVTGVASWMVVSGGDHDSEAERCSRAVALLERPAGGSAARVARWREAAEVSSDQVRDVKTVIVMARAVKNAGGIRPQTFGCDASMTTQDLKAVADKAEGLNGRYRELDRAAKAVLASCDAKDLDDARTALDTKKEEASRLLGDSDGKVTDNATREALQHTIGQAEQTKGDKAQAWRDAVGPLQAAIDQVNASMQAKAQADQQAAERAAREAARQQAQAAQQTASSYRPSYGQNGGGGWTSLAPAQQSAPSTPRGSGSNWRERLNSQQPLGNGCNPDGSCGIG
ncbi:hypothetical protein [Bifidobacterium coryneforme]|uniref:hypothetical protein n=1 Tax=Bifidobacterium coryneforme TaxID=1687 RepID=UPI0004E5E8CA|nr:hypothetical protein [Bifidobacterium coryneforme]AII74403.1 hypothetical protein BCOR_0384 [Bifidobacterium coryneforme]